MQLSLFLDPQEGMTYRQIVAATLRAEQQGYHGVYRSDHLTSTAGQHDRAATEAWSTLAGLAGQTRRIRLGTLVSPIGFRHPSLYAKIVSTVDEMSDGRVDVSIGTGWYRPEHDLLGFDFPPLAERFSALQEYLEVLVRLWGDSGERYAGSRFRLGGVRARPRSQPRPWLILGGHGSRWTPRLAARFADEFNVDWPAPERCRELFDVVAQRCREIGRDPATLRRSVLLGAIVGTDEADTDARFRRGMEFLGIADPRRWRDEAGPGWTVGTTAALAARLAEYARVGVDHVMLMLLPGDDLEMISLVAREVFPAIGHRVAA